MSTVQISQPSEAKTEPETDVIISQGTNAKPAKAKLSLNKLVKLLTRELAKGDFLKNKETFDAVQTAMENFDVDRQEWRRYFSHEQGRYTRNLIATSNDFLLMLLVWDKGCQSSIHSHGGSQCWVRVVSGSVDEKMFQTESQVQSNCMVPQQDCQSHQPLKPVKHIIHDAGGVCFINDDVGVHSLGNASGDELAVTLHCYAPPYFTTTVWPDHNDQAQTKTCSMSFDTEMGEKPEH